LDVRISDSSNAALLVDPDRGIYSASPAPVNAEAE
jgi:hypothetical protein